MVIKELSSPLKQEKLDSSSLNLTPGSTTSLMDDPSLKLFSRSNSSSSLKQLSAASQTAGSNIPSSRAVYNLSVSGSTYFGNTSFLSPQTRYSLANNFRLGGTLVVDPGILPSNLTSSANGRNAKDLILQVGGGPYSSVRPAAGAAQFATNSVLHRLFGGGSSQNAAIDVAYVNTNQSAGTIDLQVDSNISRTVSLNSFLRTGGLLASPAQVLSGNMNLRFSNGGRNVTGSVTFYGSGYIQPGTGAYTATFSGTRSA